MEYGVKIVDMYGRSGLAHLDQKACSNFIHSLGSWKVAEFLQWPFLKISVFQTRRLVLTSPRMVKEISRR